jgi:tellurite resistance protein TehA-like permease
VRSVGPVWFALVMATGIVSIAADRQGSPRLSLALLTLAAVSYLLLVVLSLVRLLRWPADVRAELAAPDRGFGSFAVVAGSAVLGERLFEQHLETAALALLGVAAVGWLLLSYAVPSLIVLAPVKPGLAAVDGLRDAAVWTAVTTWAVGVVLYLTLVTLLLLRLLVAPVAPHQMTPPYWIMMGATAITVLAGSRILQLDGTQPVVRLSTPLVEGLSLLLWAFGTWTIPLLVIFGSWRHVLRRERLTFTPQLWTVVFPLGMYSVATAEFGQTAGLAFLAGPARAAFWVAVVAWVAVFGAMLASFATGPWRSGTRSSTAAR